MNREADEISERTLLEPMSTSAFCQQLVNIMTQIFTVSEVLRVGLHVLWFRARTRFRAFGLVSCDHCRGMWTKSSSSFINGLTLTLK